MRQRAKVAADIQAIYDRTKADVSVRPFVDHDGVPIPVGTAPEPASTPRVPLRRLSMRGLSAVHEDGTVGVEDVDLDIDRGELVLLVGQVGSGKSSLLRAVAGLADHRGSLRWNGVEITDPEVFLRPGQVAYVGQVPRVLSGTFDENVRLGFDRAFESPIGVARLGPDVEQAGGAHSLVGHRGVRLSGGQVQRLALARAVAADAELLLADDVSSALDARTGKLTWVEGPRKTSLLFLQLLYRLVTRAYRSARVIHVILDNSGSHKHPQVLRWLARHWSRQLAAAT